MEPIAVTANSTVRNDERYTYWVLGGGGGGGRASATTERTRSSAAVETAVLLDDARRRPADEQDETYSYGERAAEDYVDVSMAQPVSSFSSSAAAAVASGPGLIRSYCAAVDRTVIAACLVLVATASYCRF